MSNDIEEGDEKSSGVDGSGATDTASAVSGAVLVSSLIITQALENFEKVCNVFSLDCERAVNLIAKIFVLG